jgi:hypothetical protein
VAPLGPGQGRSGKDKREGGEGMQEASSLILHLPGALVMDEKVLVECLGMVPLCVPPTWTNAGDEVRFFKFRKF